MLIPNAKGWKRATTKQEQQEAGAKLRTLISEAMLTRAEAADLIGVDQRTMRRYVLGQTRYPYSVWFAVQVLKNRADAHNSGSGISHKVPGPEEQRHQDA